jgi:hypothetical protein
VIVLAGELPVIVLVTGGRDFSDRRKLDTVLDGQHARTPFDLLIHGAAPGADTLANLWAFSRGIQPVACPALWDFYGKPAGRKRNRAMLLIRPNMVIAFPGGTGTANMCEEALQAGVTVLDYRFVYPNNQDLIS